MLVCNICNKHYGLPVIIEDEDKPIVMCSACIYRIKEVSQKLFEVVGEMKYTPADLLEDEAEGK
jgi:hypothetical protein